LESLGTLPGLRKTLMLLIDHAPNTRDAPTKADVVKAIVDSGVPKGFDVCPSRRDYYDKRQA
jgi:hypothetical protein